jgi:hypothetical protein
MRWMPCLVLMGLVAAPALANDSTAELTTGGLVLTKTDAIEMRSEELTVSTKEIRVRYRFFNKTDRAVTTLVAFPMPDVTSDGTSDTALPTEDPVNLLGFKTTVDGRSVNARAEQKAFAKDVDHTALLQRLRIPLAPHLQSTNRALDRLPREQWDELVKLGLAEIAEYSSGGQGSEMEKHLEARWTLKTTFYWEQTFPARREIGIDHRYQPSVGASVMTSLGHPELVKEPWFAEYQQKYCMDKDFLAAVDRARRGRKADSATPLAEERIAYVLKTGANWAGPIGDFRLVVDKGAPTHIVSFCGEGVKKISATQFEMRKRDFTPQADLYILILKPLPAE